MYSEFIWLTKMDFGQSNIETGQKMVNSQLLFLALQHTHTHEHTHIKNQSGNCMVGTLVQKVHGAYI